MTSTELRPLSLGELLDRTFSYYRKHLWLFVGIMAVPSVFIVALGLLGEAMQSLATASGTGGCPKFRWRLGDGSPARFG